MKPPFIKAELQSLGYKYDDIAETLGISNKTVSRVIRGNIASRRVADEIARLTGRPVSTLFGKRYNYKPKKAA